MTCLPVLVRLDYSMVHQNLPDIREARGVGGEKTLSGPCWDCFGCPQQFSRRYWLLQWKLAFFICFEVITHVIVLEKKWCMSAPLIFCFFNLLTGSLSLSLKTHKWQFVFRRWWHLLAYINDGLSVTGPRCFKTSETLYDRIRLSKMCHTLIDEAVGAEGMRERWRSARCTLEWDALGKSKIQANWYIFLLSNYLHLHKYPSEFFFDFSTRTHVAFI